MRRKNFNRNTLMDAIEYLQCVTPTDTEHPAHWYNEPFGASILNIQKLALNAMKLALQKCETKSEVGSVLNEMSTPNWPIYTEKRKEMPSAAQIIKTNKDWWTGGFGGVIRQEWYVMLAKFVNAVNELE